MPIGDTIEEIGLVLRSGQRTILRRDDGGEWQLDLLPKHGDPVGQRVRVRGRRSGFDLIDVQTLDLA